MRSTTVVHLFVVFALIAVPALLAPSPARAQAATPAGTGATGPLTVVASGLTIPRGFAWGPDGTLSLALAGSGGETRIPVSGGFTLQIGLSSSVVTVADGCTAPLQVGLVSTHWEETGWIWGAMDVAYLGDALYVLLGGSGPSWRSPASFSGVFKVNTNRTMDLVANLSAWLPANKPSFIAPDFNPDGSLYGLAAAGDDAGNAYVGFTTAAPYVDGTAKVVRVAPDGTVSDAWTGLTAVTDVAFGPDGTLYASEMATGNTTERPFLTPNSGRVVRQTGPDTLEPVVTDLPYPVSIGFAPDGQLVVAAPAFGPDAGAEQGLLVAVDPSRAPVSYAGFEAPATSCL